MTAVARNDYAYEYAHARVKKKKRHVINAADNHT